MKRFLIATLVLLPLTLAAQIKIAVVNSLEVFNAMPEKIEAEKSLQNHSKQLQQEYLKLQDEFNKKFADYQAVANDKDIAETIRERRLQELNTEDKKIQDFQKSATAEIDKERARLMEPINEKIQTAIESVGETEGCAIVFDTAKTPVAYTGPYTEDITPKVKAHLGL